MTFHIGKNAYEVLKTRYLLKDKNGKIIETPKQMFKRVAKSVSKNKKQEKIFYEIMINKEFLPNSPTLMNAGTKLGQLSACFILPIEDSIDGIFGAVYNMAKIHQSGGGTGFSFSKLRPEGDIVMSTKGIASGPVSFMKVFDTATDVIKQGGKRRGANMGILSVNHPDIKKFINIKQDPNAMKNFNLSVSITDKFINAVKRDSNYPLINPRTKKIVKKIKARTIFNLIVKNAWKTGDPGLIFIDEINRKSKKKIQATNPCGEVPAVAYESCNLGSINVSKLVQNKKIDWERLRYLVHNGVVFLNNVIDVNKFPLKKIEKTTKANRRIGLGIMGFAEMLIKLGIPYDSDKAVKTAEKLMKFIKTESRKKKKRNIALTTIAPTGTISIIAECSSGIEPLFAVSFYREVIKTRFLEINSLFREIAKERKFYSKALMQKIAKKGSVQGLKQVPKDIQRLFRTALEIKPEAHIKIQAGFQKYTDNAVSKTINLPKNASVNDIKKAFLLAYKLKCKGITVYRYGSKPQQVLYIGKTAHSEYAGGCLTTYCPY
jgi:ribonucleoside-diphosphate reductase alpha chain